jgi:hypothetical protein
VSRTGPGRGDETVGEAETIGIKTKNKEISEQKGENSSNK